MFSSGAFLTEPSASWSTVKAHWARPRGSSLRKQLRRLWLSLPGPGLSTCVFGEADGERGLLDLLFKYVLLVKEQDDGRVCEPFVVADAVEKLQGLVHAVLQQSGEAGEGWQCPGPRPPVAVDSTPSKGRALRHGRPCHRGTETGGPTGQTDTLLTSFHSQAGWGAEQGGQDGERCPPPHPCRRPPWGGAAKSPGGAPAHGEDMHHARGGRGSTTIQHVYTEPRAMQSSLPGSHSVSPAGVGGCTHSFGKH